jgi:hypothetical protein
VVVLKDVLQPQAADRLSRFLDAETEIGMCWGLYSTEPRGVSEAEWLVADEADRFYRFGTVRGARRESALSANAMAFLQFRAMLHTADWARFIEDITGEPVGAIVDDVHVMRGGDFLRVHTDDLLNRRFAYVLYLSRDWTPICGGALHLVGPDGHTTVVEAEYNSLVLFDVTLGTRHFVAPIEPAAGLKARLSISGWLMKPDEVRGHV